MLSIRGVCPECRAIYRDVPSFCLRDGADLNREGVDPLVGTVLDDRYYVEALIFEGSHGRVYRACHVRLPRRCTIKVPFGEVVVDPVLSRSVDREAEAASMLDHPNVVSVMDAGETTAGMPYIVLDLAAGITLKSALEAATIPTASGLDIVVQIATGLAHLHDHHLIHGDLGLESVMVECDDRARWRARIVDLEIARDRTWGPRADLRGLGAIARGLMRLDVDPLITALVRALLEPDLDAALANAHHASEIARLVSTDRAAARLRLARWLPAETVDDRAPRRLLGRGR